MPEQTITCPNCGYKIPLTEAFTHDIEEKLRRQFVQQAETREREHQAALQAQEKELEKTLVLERKRLEEAARKRAEESLSTELADLKADRDAKAKTLEEARKRELELRQRQREVEEKQANLELDLQRKLDAEVQKARADSAAKLAEQVELARQAAEQQLFEQYRLKDAEKEKQLTDMRRQIEDLKRKAEQGSQQMQGEVQEIELEELLRENFRFDTIEPVGKGVRGGDVIQRIQTGSGSPVGTLLWESKRTKAWSDGWITKLKDDQREAQADVAVMVTEVLPKGLARMGNVDGVWVTDFAGVVGIASILRASLIELAGARRAQEGRDEKMHLLYQYVFGPEFRRRVEGMVEAFVSLKDDLEAEKRAMEKSWAKREKQIARLAHGMAGMYGDLEGLVGAALPHIRQLELPGGEE